MATGDGTTDERLGFAILLGIGVLIGGLMMVLAPGETFGAVGFAVAIVIGLGLIVGLHLIE